MIPKNSAQARLCLLLLGAAWVTGCSRPAAPADTSAGTGAPGSEPLQKVTLLLDWYPSAEHGGLYQALVKNYYRDAGLDVTIAPGGPASFPLQMVGTGRAPFALGRCDDVILAVRQGLPLVIVCAQMEHDPQAVMMHADSPVKTLKDLDGRSVMVGPAANWVAYVQAHYGIKFQVIPMDWGIGRFISDKDFIQQCFISNEPYYAEIHGVKTRAILVTGAGYDPYRVIFTSRSFALAHPEAVRGFVAATLRGYTEFLHGDAALARARIQAENPSQTPGLIDYSLSAMKEYKVVEGDAAKGERTGLVTPERMNALQQTLVELKILDAPMPLDRFVSFDFLPPGLASGAK
jgi:NitT/TauT family transport system substrate-binding protein